MFSKLDLSWGFDMIELKPNSRDVTSCATDDVIFRYKRLSFGVNAAPDGRSISISSPRQWQV